MYFFCCAFLIFLFLTLIEIMFPVEFNTCNQITSKLNQNSINWHNKLI